MNFACDFKEDKPQEVYFRQETISVFETKKGMKRSFQNFSLALNTSKKIL